MEESNVQNIYGPYGRELHNSLSADLSPIWHRILPAAVYPLGFIVCLMSGNQLFTEQTATAFYPVLDKKACLKSLVVLWTVVIFGNLLGTLIMTYGLSHLSLLENYKEGIVSVYHHFTSPGVGEIFLSSMFAGWLMAQGGWLVLSTPPASSQVICVYIVTFLIGLAGFHHSIAGSAEVFLGLFYGQGHETALAIGALATSLVGNLIGGSILVGLLNYGHIRQIH